MLIPFIQNCLYVCTIFEYVVFSVHYLQLKHFYAVLFVSF
uniref:Uncharacterized protein n=1 Tax=Arundo donax TaxID=35708 RepID=A0A0A9BH95_ARUDO